MKSDRLIIHPGNEVWYLEDIIRVDFPILKSRGYKFVSVIEGYDCECFVCGWKYRNKAIMESMLNSGSTYDLANNKKLF